MSKPLICEECGSVAGATAKGWRGLLTAEDEGEPERVALFCPDCAKREFGHGA
jgi:hypothetical protein